MAFRTNTWRQECDVLGRADRVDESGNVEGVLKKLSAQAVSRDTERLLVCVDPHSGNQPHEARERVGRMPRVDRGLVVSIDFGENLRLIPIVLLYFRQFLLVAIDLVGIDVGVQRPVRKVPFRRPREADHLDLVQRSQLRAPLETLQRRVVVSVYINQHRAWPIEEIGRASCRERVL